MIKLLKLLSVSLIAMNSCAAAELDQRQLGLSVDAVIQPLMLKHNIPGMAVGITVKGKSYFYNYGVASRDTRQPIAAETLFELGSISKTFTATLASYAQLSGKLNLADPTSKYLPALRGSSFDKVSVLNAGTHTTGGLPLQAPNNINTTAEAMDYLKQWRPAHAVGTVRTYSNPGTGLLGMAAAASLNEPFDDAIEKRIFRALGMAHSYFKMPADQVKNYAQGYTKTDAPIRMTGGVFGSEAYGVTSTTGDLIRFIEANMQVTKVDAKLQRALVDTHTGYFTVGEMTQALMWERYPYPVELKRLLAGNGDTMAFDPMPAVKLSPPLAPQANMLINKTGSTNGFAGYIAFIPAKKIGIVILANKNYPISARVPVAYDILTQLDR